MRTTIWAAALGAALGACTIAGAARADPRLDEKVYAPFTEDHVLELEGRWGQELGSGALGGSRTWVGEAEYGFNDRLSLALVGQVERGPGEADHVVGVGLEGVWRVGRIPGIGVDSGVYLEYKKGLDGEADEGEAKLLLAKSAGRFRGLVNLIVERPFGTPAGEEFASYGYAVSATWRTVGHLRVGAEAFGDLGDDHGFLKGPQGAYVGPQLKWAGRPRFLPMPLEIDAGWLVPVGPAGGEGGSQLRLSLAVEKRF